MTFDEYLEAAIEQLQSIQESTREHADSCSELCTHCAMYTLLPVSIATIKAAMASEEKGICDDPNCISNLAYNIAKSLFEEIERKSKNA
jgi:spore maturation protein SpmA